MGGRGSFGSIALENEESRMYETIYKLDDNILVLEQKDKHKGIKLPEESHSPDRVYVSFKKDGSDIKEISVYGYDGKKLFAIHTDDHHGLHPHYHPWEGGMPKSEAYTLTQEMQDLLKRIRKLAR